MREFDIVIVGLGPTGGTLANLFAEGSLKNVYPEYSVDGKGMGRLVKDFSWPHTYFPSHVTPTVPGSILEGGELGYSLSTAFGAAMDNPDLIVAVAVGDGEAETGSVATAWHSTKFMNPKTCGAVLPIVHINGYKICNPTLYGSMSNKELKDLFKGYGYEPIFVQGPNVEEKMMEASEKAYKLIREIQKKARSSKEDILKPIWPVILLRTPKGWKGVKTYHGKPIEGSFHSHGIPIGHPNKDPDALETVKNWLESYNVNELVDSKGRPKKEILEYVPKGKLRMGVNKHAVGGNFYKKLKFPKLSKHELDVPAPGKTFAKNTTETADLIRDLVKLNPKNFRVLCPDEIESNKLESVFEVTNRAYMWPTKKNDEHMSPDGRVMEILSENTLQGWYQGYLLTGRHGILISYEAFLGIISTMVDQYAKFIKQALKVKWRKDIGSAVYLLSSVGWRQDHNGYSHQNPSFVSNVLQKHGKMCQIYYPSDANSLLVAYEEAFNKKNSICVIVAGKRELPQWQTLKQAREQAKTGIAVWDWVGGKTATKNPDVVLASAGDYITQEAIYAVKLCKELAPELKVRYVNVSEVTSLGLGDDCMNGCNTAAGIEKYFTKDKPVVFNYHGYTNDIEHILWNHAHPSRFTIHGYSEEGSTTTPFDIKISNGVSFYHVAIELIIQGAKTNKKLAKRKASLVKKIQDMIASHQKYIKKYGDDPQEVKDMKW